MLSSPVDAIRQAGRRSSVSATLSTDFIGRMVVDPIPKLQQKRIYNWIHGRFDASYVYLTAIGRKAGLPRRIEIWFIEGRTSFSLLAGP